MMHKGNNQDCTVYEIDSSTVATIELQIELKQQITAIKVLSTFTLLQLHAMLTSVFNLEGGLEADSSFSTEPISKSSKLRNIKYLNISSTEHHDGWLTSVCPGVYVSHPHPHEPNYENFEVEHVRSQHMFNLGLVLNKYTPLLKYVRDNTTILIRYIGSSRTHQEEINAFYAPSQLPNCCQMCYLSDCHYEGRCGASTAEQCCNYCLSPSNQSGWQGLNHNAKFEDQIYQLVNQTTAFLLQEREVFQQALRMNLVNSIKKGPRFHCQWVESTGESCAYCTQDFL